MNGDVSVIGRLSYEETSGRYGLIDDVLSNARRGLQ